MAAIGRNLRKPLQNLLQKQVTCTSVVPVRCLNLQEFHSKKLMADAGINVQRFRMATTDKEGIEAGQYLMDTGAKELVIKAQILAGGRGKGVFDNGYKGGVHLTKDVEKVGPMISNMVGHKLKTKQTSKDGATVYQVMVAQALDIERETYFAILMDREASGPVMVGSPEGGVDIEEVAETHPDKIMKEPIAIDGVTMEQAMKMAGFLEFTGPRQTEAAKQIIQLYKLFMKVDATQVEINPFGETPDGEVVCFDAKINFDDNAEFRQKDIFALNDTSETDWREVKASEHNLNYIGMDGNIGCLVNGAGLAMATMDIVKLSNGEPANFLDVGGGVTEAQVLEAFKLLTADEQVKSILVNIFGGIVNCATIANGITNACRNMDLSVPLVVRLEGTNVDEAKKILRESGLPITPADDLGDAARKAVASIQ
ncbi:unnamed protein product [Owenia fusiformis]|uniref:Succinate--CoA ligase [GDP-forming] subunit beta, mitochondrial n=1 Tax=Owenia fusiformis TaxID=6347 RepID=A0A8S4NQJ5_OWEFU|nr:unnamed protein product [Owenia fusiformis]